MSRTGIVYTVALAICCAVVFVGKQPVASSPRHNQHLNEFDRAILANVQSAITEGRETFRFDTFGDEEFWGDTLQLHKAIEGARFGGIGSGVSPRTALALGLKVDVDALPEALQQQLKKGQVDVDDPAVTLALLKLNAVIGVTGIFNADGSLKSTGIQCAMCHSTVDNSMAPGIGHRLDGWANRDLNVGAIVAAAPNLQPVADLLKTDVATVRAVLNSWGPGKFDAGLLMDGKAFNPQQVSNGVVTGTNVSAATLIPPAFGLAGVNLHTWTGWGSVTHWNAFVANLEMHGKGTFFDPRLDNATQFPIAAANGFGHVRNNPDLITSKLPALHQYQLAIPAPAPPDGSFDKTAAERGDKVFSGKGQCSTCHVEPIWTEPGWNLHKPSDVCVDSFQADRAPDRGYRTAPLNGLWTHQKGGFYHDGRFATLNAVVDHYDKCMSLGLSAQDKLDLVEYLKSLPNEDEQ
ncbi:MAG TPA: hypothetical protein VN577_07580 [Terriglobales bacterium]|nr:hypothetical protein [Terriglobales bacterium]